MATPAVSLMLRPTRALRLALVGMIAACDFDWPPPIDDVLACDATPTELAFPTAEGFGAKSKGGRGGRVVRVTTLANEGEGSFRWACELTEPRIIVFDVSGTIFLERPVVMSRDNSFVTIAGQTSPGGVQIQRSLPPPNPGGILLDLRAGFHDGVIRHMRFRTGTTAKQGYAVQLWGNEGVAVQHVIIDHTELMWSSDSLASTWGYVTDITWQWNTFAEAVTTFEGGEGFTSSTSSGDLVADDLRYSLHHNLFSNNKAANPSINRSAVFDFRNNVIHQWEAESAGRFGGIDENGKKLAAVGNFVGNVYVRNPGKSATFFMLTSGASATDTDRTGTQIFAEDNVGLAPTWEGTFYTRDTGTVQPAPEGEFRSPSAFDAPAIQMHPTDVLESAILEGVGATRPSRDAASEAVINDVKARKEAFKAAGGPWPELVGPPPKIDSDNDGMPDSWEVEHKLDPADASDGAKVACNGWTNIENYLNELAGDVVP